jgi:hypothetical protein
MQGESRWPRRCGSETQNSPIDAGLENQTAEDPETQVSLGAVEGHFLSIPEESAFAELSSSGCCR